MTAQQARDKVKEEQYGYVIHHINSAIMNSHLNTSVYIDLFQETLAKLEENGYKVTSKDYGVYISW